MLKNCILAVAFLSVTNAAAAATDAELERQFTQTVRPFLATYCTGCHAGAKPQANLDLGQYSTVESVVRDYDHWAQVVEKLTAKAMPPKVAKQPSESSRRDVIDWINDLKKSEAAKNAGDPGRVLARRLSNAEYNYTIRDLTGVDFVPPVSSRSILRTSRASTTRASR